MGGRTLSRAFRASDCAFRSALIDTSRRTFTSSARCQAKGGVPAFGATSSPELDRILSRFRSHVFLPAHLSKAQQNLVYKTRHKRMLASEPVIVNVGGEDFQLQHIDRTKDVPNAKEGLYKILQLMQDKKDWDNLPSFLTGLNRAGISRKILHQYTIVNKAADAGRLDVVLECARSASNTGFLLNDLALVEKLVLKIRGNAMDSEWTAKETAKALSWVEMISVMLEDKKHGWSGTRIKDGDPRVSLALVGSLLELSAVRAARHLDGKDEDGKVARFAETLLGLPSDVNLAETQDPVEALHEKNRWLLSAIPAAHGTIVARTVLDPASATAEKLKIKESQLKERIAKAREFILSSETPFKGSSLAVYDKLLA